MLNSEGAAFEEHCKMLRPHWDHKAQGFEMEASMVQMWSTTNFILIGLKGLVVFSSLKVSGT